MSDLWSEAPLFLRILLILAIPTAITDLVVIIWAVAT